MMRSFSGLLTLSLAKTLRGFEIKSLQPIVAALFRVTSHMVKNLKRIEKTWFPVSHFSRTAGF
jgi:hypothetical protein